MLIRRRPLPVVLALVVMAVLACGGLTPSTAITATPAPATAEQVGTKLPAEPTLDPGTPAPGLTQAEAQTLALQQLTLPAPDSWGVIVFAWPQPLTSADRLQAYPAPGYEPIPAPAAIGGEAWFFWADDAPGALFAHPSRFVLVDRSSGAVTIWNENWWPTLNGQGLWIESDDYWNEANWAYGSGVTRPQGPKRSQAHAFKQSAAPIAQLEQPGAGVVINTWRRGQPLREMFLTDTSRVSRSLSRDGFEVTAIERPWEALNADGTTTDLTDTIGQYMAQQAANLTAGETFVVYLTGHGFNSGGIGVTDSISETLLANWLSAFKPGVHIIVVVMSCYSGAYRDGLSQVADLVITSTDDAHFSLDDFDPDPEFTPRFIKPDPNPQDEGSEFNSGFTEDWRQIQEDEDLVWLLRITQDPPGSNYWERLFRASLTSEMEKDAALLNERSFPGFLWGPDILLPQPGGSLDVVIHTVRDVAQHAVHIKLPSFFSLSVRPGSIIFDGPDPFVDVEGAWHPDGTFEANGVGTVAGFANVSVTLTGTLTAEGLVGFYTMGAGGELPQGESIVYQLDGVWLDLEDGEPGETLDDFLAAFVPALQRNHQLFLFERLHSAVLERYGAEQCRQFLANRGTEADLALERTGDTTVGPWDWALDGRTTPINLVATVPVSLTRGGETTAAELHFGIEDGRLTWFTDCGEPIN